MDNFFMYWFIGIGMWVLLGFSIYLTYFAFRKMNWKLMFIATILSVPNTILGLLGELENIIVYLLLIWFVAQLLMIFILYRRVRNENKRVS